MLQRMAWDRAAQGWQSWWQTFERDAQKVSDKLVQMAELKPGDRVLDVATGIGEPAMTAARRVRPSGKMTAIDISPQMVSIATARAKSLGLEGIIEFRQSDAEQLDFTDGSFDAVLSRWGMMFLPNLPSVLARIKRMLVGGGRLAAAVWSTPSRVPVLDLAFTAVRKAINAPPPPPGTPSVFDLADTDLLERLFSQAGFSQIRVEILNVTFGFDSASTFTAFHRQVTAPIQAMLASQTEERKQQVWDSLTDAASTYADSHGRVSIDNEAICVVGKS